MLKCAYDGCGVTAETKKGRYTYYRCTGCHGKCALPYFREEALAERLGTVLKDIYVPDEILAQLTKSLIADKNREAELVRRRQELSSVRRRIDQAYLDKVDGRISEEFWVRTSADWQAEEQQIVAPQAPEAPNTDRMREFTSTLDLKQGFFSIR